MSALSVAEVISRLEALANPEILRGQQRFAIATHAAYGIRVPDLRRLAREIGRSHEMAQQLWTTRKHEARILASMVDDPKAVTESQMEEWAHAFDSWDLCDQCCGNLFDKTPFAYEKLVEWSSRPEEFVKRAAFSLMAQLAVHDKKASDAAFLSFLPIIEREAHDSRNFVKKAVNWALRSIGKRNSALNEAAISTAEAIAVLPTLSARWIASDALCELRGGKLK